MAYFPLHREPTGSLHFTSRSRVSTAEDSASNTVSSIKHLFNVMAKNAESERTHVLVRDQSCDYNAYNCELVGENDVIHGNGFSLTVKSQQKPIVQLCEENSTSFLKLLEDSHFPPVCNAKVNPVFHVNVQSIEASPVTDGVNVQLTFEGDNVPATKYVVLQKDVATSKWHNITDACNVASHKNVVIDIPVEKSATIWVISVKLLFISFIHALLALLNGDIIFRIIIYYKFEKRRKVKVRILGTSEELYQNQRGLRTGCAVAVEEKFTKSSECIARQFSKTGSLNVKFFIADQCVCSDSFDLGRRTTKKFDKWIDCQFDIKDFENDMKVEVRTASGDQPCWCVNLNEIIPLEQPVQQPVESGRWSFDDEVHENQVGQLARHVNKDGERLAIQLGLERSEINEIKWRERNCIRQNEMMICSWRRRSLQCRSPPTWNVIQVGLAEIGRFDVIRKLLGEKEISDELLDWLADRITSICRMYARVLYPDEYHHEIDIICYDCTLEGCRGKSFQLLKRWRQFTPLPTIEDLIKALEHDLIQRHETARDMRDRFCKK